jgi:phosphocarrier protein
VPALESEFTIRSELGLHARPAGQFVTIAGRFECSLEVCRGDECVDGRSILSLLSLAAGPGTVLRLRADGPDAQAAIEALGAVLESTADPVVSGA